LKTIGSIEDITPGERLYSARFVGDRGYLVTFVKVDPLIALDLSDPKKPEIKGELILPGYSTYIHPLNDGYLLTVGRDTTDSGYGFAWYQGIQLTIFDVRDMSKPKVAHQLIAGDRNTQAEALSNHKAITFMADRGILAFHMNSGYGTSATGSKESLDINESGLYVFGVSVGKGFNFMSDIPDEGYSDRTRGVIIGDSIYSVSSYSIGAAALSNLDGDISRIILDTPYECIDGISCSETVEGLE
jgi:hypothetical protein